MKSYDVAIVGGGPAGAIFAAELASALPELSILLIDAQSPDKQKVCGGLLAPDAQRVLAMLGLTLPKDILSDPQIFDVETIDIRSKCVRHYQRHYLNMDRYAFDKWLISLIPEGVDIINGTCLDITDEGDGFYLTIKSTDEASVVKAKYIVGADGANSIIRRTFFKSKTKKYVAIQQHFLCSDISLPPYSCIFDSMTSDSCSWTIRKDGYFIYGGAFESRGCRDSFEKQKKRLEEFIGTSFGKAIKTEACLLTSPRRFSDFITGDRRIFLIGEAAGFISASSFEGLSSAMLSGRLLAEAFASAKSDDGIFRSYKKKSLRLKLKLFSKIQKRRILCSPILRYLIMKSGIQSVNKY